MSVILELSVFPLDNNTMLSRFVAQSISIIKESGLPYSLGTLSACIEGEWDNVMDVAKQCLDAASKNSMHVHVDMRVVWRDGAENRLVTS